MAFPGRTDGAPLVCQFLTSQWTPSKAKLSTCRRRSRAKQRPLSGLRMLTDASSACPDVFGESFRRVLSVRSVAYTGDRPPRRQKLLTASILASFDSLDLDSGRPRGPGRHYTSIVGEWCGKARRLCRDNATARACAWYTGDTKYSTGIDLYGTQAVCWDCGRHVSPALARGSNGHSDQVRSFGASNHVWLRLMAPTMLACEASELLFACCIQYCGYHCVWSVSVLRHAMVSGSWPI